MSSISNWTATLTTIGDDPSVKPFNAATNVNSPATDQFVNLAMGANTITAPVAAAPTRLTIQPPSGNTQLITLKGVAGDTGVPIHKTDPTSVALDSSVTTLVLNAAAIVNGVRLIWS